MVRRRVLMSRAAAVTLLAAAALLLSSGCGRGPSGTQRGAREQGAGTQVERGGVRARVEVAPAPARLSDEPTLTLTVEHEPGIEVTMPPFGAAVGDFQVRDFHEPLPEVRGRRQILRHVYTLEPLRTGTLAIDPITIHFRDQRGGGDGRPEALQTEALAVEVVSLIGAEAPSLDDLSGLAAPVALPAPRRRWWWWLAGWLAALLAAAVAARVRRRRRADPPPPPPPRELARRALDRLWREQLHRRDVKRFYAELTGVVRQFVERSWGLRAPEQTTEEFLRDISATSIFSLDERRRLKDFLEAADLVKFAGHQPPEEDVVESYQRARDFVELDPPAAPAGAPPADAPRAAAEHAAGAGGRPSAETVEEAPRRD